jgi:hypothetical protein
MVAKSVRLVWRWGPTLLLLLPGGLVRGQELYEQYRGRVVLEGVAAGDKAAVVVSGPPRRVRGTWSPLYATRHARQLHLHDLPRGLYVPQEHEVISATGDE